MPVRSEEQTSFRRSMANMHLRLKHRSREFGDTYKGLGFRVIYGDHFVSCGALSARLFCWRYTPPNYHGNPYSLMLEGR